VFVTLGALAASTARIQIGTSVVLGVLRPPVLLAKAATSVDVMSNGRLILGLGVGSRPEDFQATEVPIQQRGRRMDEAIEICTLAWSGQALKFDGRHHHLDVGPMRELPVQRPHPPLWFGGGAEAVLRRTARVGQGFIASTSSGPDGFRSQWSKLREYCGEIGRDAAEITPAALCYASVAANRADAEEAMRQHLLRSFGPARLERGLGPLVGTPDDLVRGADTYFAAGVDVLIISSVSADLRQLDLLCERVLPALGGD
ncbi:MAG TPA: TIGR03619 family F420-dependent LLM class oxidoreductase, partial [Chloroflexota bacterium]|nr:TIGR03619 family F420-dependent LLM class oxidoreductase [Chloroflexota bacterium]